MKALVFDGFLSLQNVESPVRQKGESLVKVLYAGICNTDLEITRGYMGFRGIPGHEFVGIVIESDNPNLTGRRVVSEINIGCRTCELCKSGDPRHCKDRTVLGILRRNGAFAEYLTVPNMNLVVVPKDVGNLQAVFTEPLAAVLQIFDDSDILIKSKIAVIGDGKLGLLAALTIKAIGYTPVLFGKHESKLKIAQQSGIKTYKASDPCKYLFEIVMECSGNPTGLQKALDIIEPKGTIFLKSSFAADAQINLTPAVINEVSIVGSRCGRFWRATEVLEEELIDCKPLITHIYPIDDALTAFKHAADPQAFPRSRVPAPFVPHQIRGITEREHPCAFIIMNTI